MLKIEITGKNVAELVKAVRELSDQFLNKVAEPELSYAEEGTVAHEMIELVAKPEVRKPVAKKPRKKPPGRKPVSVTGRKIGGDIDVPSSNRTKKKPGRPKKVADSPPPVKLDQVKAATNLPGAGAVDIDLDAEIDILDVEEEVDVINPAELITQETTVEEVEEAAYVPEPLPKVRDRPHTPSTRETKPPRPANPVSAKNPNYEDVKTAVRSLLDARKDSPPGEDGVAVVKNILAAYKVKKVSEMNKTHYGHFIQKIYSTL